MIFSIFYTLLNAGFSACGLLLGSYMMHYTKASSLDLGFVFMLQPLTIFCRIPICAYADRFQNHKKLLCLCLLWSSFSYIPFIVLPFLLMNPTYNEFLTDRMCFWIAVISHLSGSLGYCGARSLGDALAVNFAKRVGSDFGQYRKYGALSFGTFAYFLGLINQNWILPDYVPSIAMYVVTIFILAVLIYLWPDEYFVIELEQEKGEKMLDDKIPRGSELLSCIYGKVCSTFSCKTTDTSDASKSSQLELERTKVKRLSLGQQTSIFLLLLRRDIRIPLFMLLILYGGLVGYAPQNFVFTYLNIVCTERGTCDSARLAGLVMFSYCLAESSNYVIINAFKRQLNYAILLALTLVSITFHYLFYGLMLNHVSPYFFLLEALHGFEYSSSLCSCMELGYKFANEVELLIPELIQRGIISKNDDFELVKVSLVATMTGTFTLFYEGIGTILGALLIGLVVDKYSFSTNWIVLGCMAAVGLIMVCTVIVIGKCLNFKPQIAKSEGTDA